jgi:hypothetical protein
MYEEMSARLPAISLDNPDFYIPPQMAILCVLLCFQLFKELVKTIKSLVKVNVIKMR